MIKASAKDHDSTPPALLTRVRAVLDAVLTPERLATHDEGEFYDVELHRLLAKEGLLQTNRLDHSQQHQVVVLEELGARATSVAVSYVIQYMGVELLRHYASAAQSQRFLSPLMAGDAFTSLALSETVGGTDIARAMETTAVKRPDGGYVISGSKKWIGGAADADFLFVLARTSPIGQSAVDGITTFIVPRDTPGIHTRPIDTMGIRALEQCDVFFNDVHVEAGSVLGEVGKGFRQILRALNTERLNGAAVAVGIARGALDTAVQYAKDRHAFHRPIGAFQGLQHMLAESSVRVEAARQLVTKAAQIADGNAETDGVMAAMAKLAASEAATTATDAGMRVMGAWGFARQSPMQRYFRDARLYTFAPITDEVTRNYIGEKHLGLPRSY